MRCEQVTELEDSYLSGELDGEERDQVSFHLKVCAHCRERISQYQEMLGRMFAAVDPVAPAPGLRRKIIRQAATTGKKEKSAPQKESKSWFPFRWGLVYNGVSTALVLSLAAFSIFLYNQVQDLSRQQTESQQIYNLTSQPDSLVWLMTQPDQPFTPGSPKARMFARADSDLYYITGNNLNAVPDGQNYVMWYTIGSQVEFGGLLQPDARGNATLKITDPQRAATSITTCFITLEKAGGTPGTPTGPPLLLWKKP